MKEEPIGAIKMIDNSKEYIICAAIWYDDGIPKGTHDKDNLTFPAHFTGATFQNANLNTGFVVGQWRHGNCIALVPTNPTMNGGIKNTVQGFLTSEGRFVDRWQGMCIAWEANQVDDKTALNLNYFRKQEDIDNHPYEMPDFDEEYMANLIADVPHDRHGEDGYFKMMFSEDIY